MKTTHTIIGALIVSLLIPFAAQPAAALSCLSVDEYLTSVVGDEAVLIFEAKSVDRFEATGHTIEVLQVTKAQQGYLEDKLFAYHEKHPDWGYLCNSGPATKGTTSLYVAGRNAENQYVVHQRLALTNPHVATLTADLQKRNITGEVSPITTTDRMNQIKTTISELFATIGLLLREFSYWSKQ